MLVIGLALLCAGLASAGSPAPAPAAAAAATSVYMLPEIFEGLFLAFFLVFFTLVGLCCILGIQTPDVLHSTTLPAGKEY